MDSVAYGHRLATEVAFKILHNRVREVTGEPVQIDIERRIGSSSDFVIADIRVEQPIQVAAEVYYQTSNLALFRRLGRMYDNGYSVYLIFNTEGRFDPAQIEKHLQKIAPLRVGRFSPATLEVSLGDLLTRDQINLDDSDRDQLPRYFS